MYLHDVVSFFQYTGMIYFLVMILAKLGFTFFFPSNDMTGADVVLIAPKKKSASPNSIGWYSQGCMEGKAEAAEVKSRKNRSHVEQGAAAGERHAWSMGMGKHLMGHVFTVLLGLPIARPNNYSGRSIFQ